MTLVKSLWAMVQGDPVFMRRVNGWFTIFWIGMIPVSIGMHWLTSVIYVSALSLWGLVTGHWSAWQAARVEVAQNEDAARRAQEDVAGEVVERLVEVTEIQPVPTGHQAERVLRGEPARPRRRLDDGGCSARPHRRPC